MQEGALASLLLNQYFSGAYPPADQTDTMMDAMRGIGPGRSKSGDHWGEADELHVTGYCAACVWSESIDFTNRSPSIEWRCGAAQ